MMMSFTVSSLPLMTSVGIILLNCHSTTSQSDPRVIPTLASRMKERIGVVGRKPVANRLTPSQSVMAKIDRA